MATIEQVEKLREKANVSYDEAKTALEASGGDMLDAIIYLERQGKVKPPQNNGIYSSAKPEAEKMEPQKTSSSHQNGETFSGLLRKFSIWIGKLIARGNKNIFEVWRKEQIVISMPVTVLVLLLIFAFWVIVPILVIGLFVGCRYIFRGADLENTGVNKMMDSASKAAENLKKEINND
jgi:hypothetical protein